MLINNILEVMERELPECQIEPVRNPEEKTTSLKIFRDKSVLTVLIPDDEVPLFNSNTISAMAHMIKGAFDDKEASNGT